MEYTIKNYELGNESPSEEIGREDLGYEQFANPTIALREFLADEFGINATIVYEGDNRSHLKTSAASAVGVYVVNAYSKGGFHKGVDKVEVEWSRS